MQAVVLTLGQPSFKDSALHTLTARQKNMLSALLSALSYATERYREQQRAKTEDENSDDDELMNWWNDDYLLPLNLSANEPFGACTTLIALFFFQFDFLWCNLVVGVGVINSEFCNSNKIILVFSQLRCGLDTSFYSLLYFSYISLISEENSEENFLNAFFK